MSGIRSRSAGSILGLIVLLSLIATVEAADLDLFPPVVAPGQSETLELVGSGARRATAMFFEDPRLQAELHWWEEDEVWPERWNDGRTFRVTGNESLEPGNYRGWVLFEDQQVSSVSLRIRRITGLPILEHRGMDGEVIPLEAEQWVHGMFPETGQDGARYSIHLQAEERILVQFEPLGYQALPFVFLTDENGTALQPSPRFGREEVQLDLRVPRKGLYLLHVARPTREIGPLVYRFRLTRSSHLEGGSPLVLLPDRTETLEVYGRNFPRPSRVGEPDGWGRVWEQLALRPDSAGEDWVPVAIETSNELLFRTGSTELQVEESEKPEQEIEVPGTVVGRFDFAGDSDAYRLTVPPGSHWRVRAGGFPGRRMPFWVGVQQVVPGGWKHLDFPLSSQAQTVRSVPPSSVLEFGFSAANAEKGESSMDGILLVRSLEGHVAPGQDYWLRVDPAEPGATFQEMETAVVLRDCDPRLVRFHVQRWGGKEEPLRVAWRSEPDGISLRETLVWTGESRGFFLLSQGKEDRLPDRSGAPTRLFLCLAGEQGEDLWPSDETENEFLVLSDRQRSKPMSDWIQIAAGKPTQSGGSSGAWTVPFELQRYEGYEEKITIRLLGGEDTVEAEPVVLEGSKGTIQVRLRKKGRPPIEGAFRKGTVILEAVGAMPAGANLSSPSGQRWPWDKWERALTEKGEAVNRQRTQMEAALGMAETVLAEARKQERQAADVFWEKRKATMARQLAARVLAQRLRAIEDLQREEHRLDEALLRIQRERVREEIAKEEERSENSGQQIWAYSATFDLSFQEPVLATGSSALSIKSE